MHTANNQILFLINGLAGKNHFLDSIMVFCAEYLVYFVFVLAVTCVVYTAYKKEWRSIGYFLGTLAVTYIILQVFGLATIDHRPFMDFHLNQLVQHAAGKSFPSDHTTVTAGIAFGLLLTRLRKIGFILIGVAALIGFSRIFVGIHYPLDIAGGLIAGALGGVVVYVIKRFIEGTDRPNLAHRAHIQ